MATTTNFGWTTPDDTGLVKDGASAIRTLGSSADTTVAGLRYFTINSQTGTSYTTVLGDSYQVLITMNNASTNALKIPTDASVNHPVGTSIAVYNLGAGTTTISAVTSGTTTIVSAGATSAAPTLTTNKSAACIKIATNSWIVVGSVA